MDFGIDYDKLAQLTENNVSADIQLIVDDAARQALHRKEKITMRIIEEIISSKKPSLTPEQIRQYDTIRDNFEGITRKEPEKKRIGLK